MNPIVEFVSQLLGSSFVSVEIEELKIEITEHLKEEISSLKKIGLSDKEAFLIAKDRFADQNIINDFQKLTLHQSSQPKKPLTNILVIGSSTGGPRALEYILSKLPKNLNTCILVVQHMPKGFTWSLAHSLNMSSELDVCESKTGDTLEDGKVFIAKGGYHLKIKRVGNQFVIENSVSESERYVPSINETLYSLKQVDIPLYVSILTGMGNDGLDGLKTLKLTKQPKVIAESKKTSTVYGMPKQVARKGLADYILDLEDMTAYIKKMISAEPTL